MNVNVVIPAYNEEKSIEKVLRSIPEGLVSKIVVVNNASTDRTAELARENGALVVDEMKRGYGQACLRGIEECKDSDIIVFLDADFSDDPSQLPLLIDPIIKGKADLVIGSRILGERQKGALPIHAQFGNILSCFLIKKLFNVYFTDLGPFRAIQTSSLLKLNMQDTNYGWTVEMQARAALINLRCTEVPVSYKKRIGRSKISGSISGSVKAGTKILWTIFFLWFKQNKIKRDYMNSKV